MGRAVAPLALVLGVFTGCASASDTQTTAGPQPAVEVVTTLDAATTTTGARVSVSAVATSPTTSVPVDQIADCVEFIPIGAFLGDELATGLWNLAGQDPAQLDALCRELSTSQPETLEELSRSLADHDATTTAATSAPTTLPATVAPSPPPTPRPTTPSTAAPLPAAPAPSRGMPDVVCMNLQDAQDLIQRVTGVFFSRSFDATGADRSQIIDSNWVVVSQSPETGASIGEGDAVLGAVKYTDAASAMC